MLIWDWIESYEKVVDYNSLLSVPHACMFVIEENNLQVLSLQDTNKVS